jgi:hypothetical protein
LLQCLQMRRCFSQCCYNSMPTPRCSLKLIDFHRCIYWQQINCHTRLELCFFSSRLSLIVYSSHRVLFLVSVFFMLPDWNLLTNVIACNERRFMWLASMATHRCAERLSRSLVRSATHRQSMRAVWRLCNMPHSGVVPVVLCCWTRRQLSPRQRHDNDLLFLYR